MSRRRTLTLDEAADVLGVARSTAYRAARTGQLPTLRFGRRLVVPEAALEALLRNAKSPEAGPHHKGRVESLDALSG